MVLGFSKMHGAGNDFIVLDRRDGSALPAPDTVVRMADRRRGIGCDQMMVLVPTRQPGSLAGYRIFNADGSDARQCGNGVRCLGAWLHRDGALADTAVLDSPAGPVSLRVLAGGGIEASLGVPDFAAAAVPIHADPSGDGDWRLDIDGLAVRVGAVSLGNPHALIEVPDVTSAPVGLALALQVHPAFPDSCNVGFVQVLARDHLRLRVIERGVGETLACGSGACAAHAWLRRAGRIDAGTRIELPGGTLAVHWSGAADEPMRMGGPTAFVFEGTWTG